MTKIILKNAGTCVNPVLTSVYGAVGVGGEYPVGTPLLVMEMQPNSINTPGTMTFQYSTNGGSNWVDLGSRPSADFGYILAYPPTFPNGTLFRIKVIGLSCTERISNSLTL